MRLEERERNAVSTALFPPARSGQRTAYRDFLANYALVASFGLELSTTRRGGTASVIGSWVRVHWRAMRE